MNIKGREYIYKIGDRDFHCAMDITMHYIGGKWKTVVLWYLRKEPRRFGELRKLMPQITEKMLSIQLKALVKDGFVIREVFAEVPPKVVYSLSKEGKSLLPLLEELASWGRYKGESSGRLLEISKP